MDKKTKAQLDAYEKGYSRGFRGLWPADSGVPGYCKDAYREGYDWGLKANRDYGVGEYRLRFRLVR